MARYGNDEGIDYFKSLTLHNFIVNLTSCHYHQVEESCSNDNEDCCCSSNVQEVAILRGGDDDIGSSSDEDEEGLLNKRASPLDDHPLDFDAVPEELDENNALSEYYFSSDNDFHGDVEEEEEKKESLSTNTIEGQGKTINNNVGGNTTDNNHVDNDTDDTLLQPLDFKSEPTFHEDDPTLDILSNFFTGDNVGGGRRRGEDNTLYANNANTNNANSIQNNKLWNDDERRNVVITTKPYARRSSLISRASSQQSFDKEKVSPIYYFSN